METTSTVGSFQYFAEQNAVVASVLDEQSASWRFLWFLVGGSAHKKKSLWKVYALVADEGDEAAAELVRCAQNFSKVKDLYDLLNKNPTISKVKRWYYENSGLGSIGALLVEDQ